MITCSEMDVLSTLEQDIQQTLSLSKRVLDAGQLVVVPSETVFGLAGCIYSRQAIDSIFKVKSRPSDNPLIVHIDHIDQVEDLASLDRKQEHILSLLYEQFWPGPLTLILPKKEHPSLVNYAAYGMTTVAVRMPNHTIFKRLLNYVGYPLAAPSANISGRPSGTTVTDIVHSLQDQDVPYILDSPSSAIGIESTVLDISGDVPSILRPGSITQESLESVLKQPIQYIRTTDQEKPRSPGQKYQHYKPLFPVQLFESIYEPSFFKKMDQQYFIVHTETLVEALKCYGNILYYPKIEDLVHDLYHLLYRLELQHCSLLWVEMYPTQGLATALMERLNRMSTN